MSRRKINHQDNFSNYVQLSILVILVVGVIYLLEDNIVGYQKKHFRSVKVKPFVSDLSNANSNQCTLVEEDFIRGDVDPRVIVITFDRPRSLLRLLKSLAKAYYDSENILIEVWIDRDKDSGTYLVDTFDVVKRFVFTNALCEIRVHPKHVGIKGQWLDTWRSFEFSREIVAILEDDLTVSPYFYKWLKLVHLKYGHRHDINGFTLQGNSIRHSDGKCCLNVSSAHKVFMYSTVGTSGFSPNNKNWMAFKVWLDRIKTRKLEVPLVPNHISSIWYDKFKMQDSMWEIEYLYYNWIRKEMTLYPIFEGHKGLTFNWEENGLHSKHSAKNSTDENDGLVLEWNLELKDLPDRPIIVLNDGSISPA